VPGTQGIFLRRAMSAAEAVRSYKPSPPLDVERVPVIEQAFEYLFVANKQQY
jgi:hypothetical protein